MTFALEKYAALLSYNRITFLTVDQVRANIKIDGPYVPKESSVGSFKDFKAASSIAALNHKLTQWMFLSKGKMITPADGYTGVDGWLINVFMEKNKNAPSKHSITVVFDKSTGINKFWSEYYFLSEMTVGEAKVYKNKKFPYQLMITKSGAWVSLKVKDPNTGKYDYKSDKFYKKEAKNKYETDPEFKKWFDYAVDMSIHIRIKEGMFKINMDEIISDEIIEDEVSTESIIVDGILDTEPQVNTELEPQVNTELEPQVNTELEPQVIEQPITEIQPEQTTTSLFDESNDDSLEVEDGYKSVF